jgi:hypothetical protein
MCESEMTHVINDSKRKNNAIVSAVTAIVMTFLTVTTPLLLLLLSQSAQAVVAGPPALMERTLVPMAVSGDNNVYIVWWTNKSGNWEVMFRASTDGGTTFGDKMNLSNTPNADSVDAEIAAEGANVMVTWWERNQTSNTPVARISTDGGETFGAMMMLGTNGTLTNTEEGGGGGETTEEEAVGGAEVAE